MREGQVLYEFYRPNFEIPPKPELMTEGYTLIRNIEYSSRQAVRQDPFWKDYEGWFVIPEKINKDDAAEEFLSDYPELEGDEEEKSEKKLQIKKLSEYDLASLKMAKFSEVDEYVCGYSEKIPELYDFSFPKSQDMVDMEAQFCHCGCGSFSHWYRYWTLKWIVYVPRAKK